MAAPTYFGSASSPADNGAANEPSTQTITPPASMLAGDLVVIIAQQDDTGATPTQNNLGGQTWETIGSASGSLRRTFWCKFNGTWSANPSIDFPASSGTIPVTAVMHVFRPANAAVTWTLDSAVGTGAYSLAGSVATVSSGGVPAKKDSVTLMAMASSDDNTWGNLTGSGWAVTGAAQYRNTAGGDMSCTFAHCLKGTPSSNASMSKEQLTLGGDAGNYLRMIFYAEAAPTVDLNSPADAASTTDATPTLDFTGTDLNGDDLEYEVQIDDASNFNELASYPSSNQDSTIGLFNAANPDRAGQCFTPSVTGVLDSITLMLAKSGVPTGNLTVTIFAITGTYGSTATPTGSVLATSDVYAAGNLTTSLQLITFKFTGAEKITLNSGTNYFLVINGQGSIGNSILVGRDASSPSHGGNYATRTPVGSVWTADSAKDLIFYVNGDPLLDKFSATDSGFVNPDTGGDTHPFNSGENIQYTVQAGDALVSGTYYWRVRACDPDGTNAYGAWSSTRSFVLTAATAYTVTKSLKYTVKTSVSAITKSLKYTVKVTPSTITKSLVYRVRATPATITKSLLYKVKGSASVTKSLKYTVKRTPSTITKSLKYTVRVTPSTITKSLTYGVKPVITVQKSLKYTVKTAVTAITKSTKYTVVKAVSAITKSLTYNVLVVSTVKFLDPGGDATGNIDTGANGGLWDTKSGAIVLATDVVHGGHINAIKHPLGATTSIKKNGVLTDAGSRVSFYLYIVAMPENPLTGSICAFQDVDGFSVFLVRMTTAGVLMFQDGGGNQIGSTGSTLTTGRWYRLSVAYTISSTSVNRMKLWIDGVLDIDNTNVTLGSTGTNIFGMTRGSFTTFETRFSDIYVDNNSSLTDTGDIWVTAKRPNANGTLNEFTTQIGSGGSGYGSGHSPQVNERPVSTTNGWSIQDAAKKTEEYTIEGASSGDINISAATIIDYMGWIYAKVGSNSTGNIIVGGVPINKSLTTSYGMFTNVKGSSTYPSGGNAIGMDTNTVNQLFSLADCGIVVAYIPAAVASITITKSLKYAVKTTPSTITKSTKYTVKTSVSAITKSVKYAVKVTPSTITKSLLYKVKGSPSVTKSLKYTVKVTPSTITKSAKYTVRIATTITKSVKYTVKAAVAAITKSLKYTVTATAATLTKSLKYAIKTTPATITKSVKYVVKAPQTITKSVKYTVVTAPTAISKSLRYAIVRSMGSTQTLSPMTVVDDAAVGSMAWNDPDNAKASDDVRAATTGYSGELDSRVTHYLKATNFGFSIPAGSVINGIKVEVERRKNSGQVVNDHSVKLVKADGTFGTENKAGTSGQFWTTSDVYAPYGSSTTLWGDSWTVSDINDSDFGVAFSVQMLSDEATIFVSVDHIRITVYFTPPNVKSLTYKIKTTSDITKSLQYEVELVDVYTITKDLKYTVIAPASLTKSLKYTVKVTPATLTKSLKYAILITTPITKSLTYKVLAPVAITKSIKYTIVKAADALTKTLRYFVSTAGTITKQVTYMVVPSPTLTKSLKYTVKAPAAITKSLAYSVGNSPILTKSLTYTVKQAQTITKTVRYAIATVTAITKSTRYAIKKSYTLTKTLRYFVEKEIAITKSLRYVVVVPFSITKTLRYMVRKAATLTKTLRYHIGRTIAITKTLRYYVVPTTAITKSVTYKVEAPHTITKSLEYVIIPTYTYSITKSAKYTVKSAKVITKTLKYVVRIYPYHRKPVRPYTPKVSPFDRKTTPYTYKTNPYSKRTSPYVRLLP